MMAEAFKEVCLCTILLSIFNSNDHDPRKGIPTSKMETMKGR